MLFVKTAVGTAATVRVLCCHEIPRSPLGLHARRCMSDGRLSFGTNHVSKAICNRDSDLCVLESSLLWNGR